MNDLHTPSARADDSTLIISLLSASKIKEVFLFFAFDEGERLLFVYRT